MTERKPIKSLNMGDPGSGKTGALATLLDAGYSVRVLDLDNNLDGLINIISHPKSQYKKDCLERLSYVTITDPMRMLTFGKSVGKLVPSSATVWKRTMETLEKWVDSEGRNYGKISSWDSNVVFVLDTLSTLSEAANNFHMALQGKLGGVDNKGEDVGQNESLRAMYASQTMIQNFLQFIRDTSIRCHVIVNSHVTYCKPDGTMPTQEEIKAGIKSRLVGLPASIGKAAAPKIPGYFPNMLFFERIGDQQQFYTSTHTDNRLSLKSSAPLNIRDRYDVRRGGLADYFFDVLQTKPNEIPNVQLSKV